MKVEKEYIVIGTGYVILIGLFALLSAWLRDLFPILEDVNFQEAFFIALIFELGFVGLILRSFLSHKIARNILLAFFLLMPVIDYLIYGHHFHRFPHGFSLVGEFCFFTFLLGLYGLAFAGSCLLFFPMLIVLMAPVIAPFVTVVFLIIYALCVIFGKGGGSVETPLYSGPPGLGNTQFGHWRQGMSDRIRGYVNRRP